MIGFLLVFLPTTPSQFQKVLSTGFLGVVARLRELDYSHVGTTMGLGAAQMERAWYNNGLGLGHGKSKHQHNQDSKSIAPNVHAPLKHIGVLVR